MSAQHLRLDVDLAVSRAQAQHDSACPDIGPICDVRDEPPQQHHSALWLTELRLLGEFGLTDRIALQASLPLRIIGTRTTYTTLAGQPLQLDYANIHHRNEDLVGVGDVQLMLHGGTTLFGFKLSGRAGVSIPAGRVHADPFELGHQGLPHQHIQFGTGTLDPLLGLDVSREVGMFSLALFGFGHLPLYAGSTGYQAGTRVSGGAVASSSFGLTRPTFRLSAVALHEAAERWSGHVPTDDGNQGRTDLFLGAGLTFPFADDWSVSLDVRGRVWGQVVGAQLDMPLVVELSIGRLFHFESGAHEVASAASAAGDVADLVANGEAAKVEGVPGKWTVIDFWAPWCEACVGLDARLRALAAERDDVAVRRVNIVDFDSPIARQELQGVELLPRLRLISPTGETVYEESGPANALFEAVRDAMTTFRCPMHPEISQTKPGPCPVCGMPLERQ